MGIVDTSVNKFRNLHRFVMTNENALSIRDGLLAPQEFIISRWLLKEFTVN